ncbi:integrin beta-PS-like [Neodiprion fabricii]|uniref:integrin beta-PS-like n=1 Tax=Neodiprion fabricii TaxID=2872261 RepID=UPI001ED8FC3B|nr:integrin beta-PS-like [Neodiprion fabricii]
MRVWFCAVIILAFESAVILGQKNVRDGCTGQKTCAACIRTLGCIWCNIEDIRKTSDTKSRCVNESQLAEDSLWCTNGKKENYTSQLNLIDDANFSSAKKGEKVVQLRPQRVNLRLRKGKEYRLKLAYKRARDYPMDLYFLVDLSISMDTFRATLSKLGSEIARKLKHLTSDFQLGFGSFIDKKNYPSTVLYNNLILPKSYAFKHSLNLTTNLKEFEKVGDPGPDVGVNDVPESGFDGIMQSIVCREQIGWRSEARNLLIHASDALPHIAGDGKIGGLPEPNDEQCHLDESGYYTHAELQDYPSIGQINHQAANNSVNILFLVFRAHHEEVYKGITRVIKGSTVRTVGSDFDNVLQVIRQEYESLVESVTMTSRTSSNVIDVQFLSKCSGKEENLRDKCDNIHISDTVEFVAEIKAITCPEREEDWHQTIEIRPQGINEKLIVNVELLCGCECSKDKPKNSEASRCRSHEKFDCGVCTYDGDFFGKNCPSKKDEDEEEAEKLTQACRASNTSEVLCSDQGRCIYGKCCCFSENIKGTFCECDDNSCRRSNDGLMCGGHGTCDCGKCACYYGWGGKACELETDTSSCLPPVKNAKACSGAGECKDGKCVCDKEKKRHGEFCEECPSCPSQKCDELKDCVECVVHKAGSIHVKSPDCDGCGKYNIKKVDAIEKNADEKNPEEHYCQIPAGDGSTFVFTYFYNGKDIHVNAEKDKKYPLIDDFVAVTLAVMAVTLLLGLLTILAWKVATHVHDKREFQKFEKERANPKWGQTRNPLYVDAVTTFQNPTFKSLREADEF